ncbi:g8141 [Coccomyxa elongata]
MLRYGNAAITQPVSLFSFGSQQGDLLGLRYLTASPVGSSSSAAVSSAAQPQRNSSAEQGSLEYATSGDVVRHEWGSVAQEPSLLYVRREPWDEAAIFPFSAKAFYVGKGLSAQLRTLYAAAEKAKYSTVWATQDSRMLCLSPLSQWQSGSEEDRRKDLPCRETYVAVFENMDTVVFFNAKGYETKIWEKLANATLPSRNIEEFKVVVQRNMRDKSRIYEDHIALMQAEPDMIKTIAYLLAQTVALHFYEMEVDNMLKVFQDINVVMERTGEFGPASAAGGGKEDLLKMVAKNNVMRTGILSSKIGLTKRFEAAWKDPECDRIYEHLRREMEIDRRYDDLEVKFDLIQDNLKYFLEIIQNKKSDFLEYMIVVLIAAEICVSLFDMWSRV